MDIGRDEAIQFGDARIPIKTSECQQHSWKHIREHKNTQTDGNRERDRQRDREGTNYVEQCHRIAKDNE